MANPIVVVGGGIVGSGIAWQLAERASTILVERDHEPQGASYFSFASLTALDEFSTPQYALKSLGMSHWRRWQKLLADDLGVRWDGEIRWAETPDSAHELRRRIDEGIRRGYGVENLSFEQLAERLPQARPNRVLAASFARYDGQADPPKAIARLREAFTERGGELLVGRATLRFDEDKIYVRAGSRDIEASRVVLATGAETHFFLEKLGWDIPMDPSPGLLVRTVPVEPLVTGTVYVTPESGPSIHLRQQPDGRFLIGERSQDYVATQPTMSHAQELLRQAQRSFPRLAGVDIEQFTVEWRPMPADGMPVVGTLPGMSSMYLATTHTGVTLAPALAELVTRELIDNEPASQLDHCRPGRFARRRAGLVQDLESAFDGATEIFLG